MRAVDYVLRSLQLRFNSNFDGVKLVDSEKVNCYINANLRWEPGESSPHFFCQSLERFPTVESLEDIHMFMLFVVISHSHVHVVCYHLPTSFVSRWSAFPR